MLAGVLHQIDDLRYRTLTKALGGTYLDNSRQVDATRDHLVANSNVARQALTSQRHRVKG